MGLTTTAMAPRTMRTATASSPWSCQFRVGDEGVDSCRLSAWDLDLSSAWSGVWFVEGVLWQVHYEYR